jgi:heat-inducible transcriptional repressor
MLDFNLSDRDKQILHAVVSMYIQTGEPVGSRAVWKRYKLPMSPATIRNIMADLEEMGFFYQPHTSAGRVPTELGLRFYIDALLKKRPLPPQNKVKIKRDLKEVQSKYDIDKILQKSSHLLSLYSHQAGIVIAPKFSRIILKQIEFVRLNKHLVLAIIVGSTGIVYHRLIPNVSQISQDDLNKFANYLNANFCGLTLGEVKARLIEEMKKDKAEFDAIWEKIVHLGKSILKPEKENVYIEGTVNILNYPEFSDVERMKALLKAFEEKGIIARLLERTMEEARVQVFVGGEITAEGLSGCSVVASPYSQGDTVLGSVAVIGPMRMNYAEIIPLVEYTAQVLSEILAKTE